MKWIAFDYQTNTQSKRVPYEFGSEKEAKDFIVDSAKDLKVVNRLVYPMTLKEYNLITNTL